MLEVAKQQGFKFDTVQMPLNVMDAHYRSFEKLVLPELVKQNIGVLGMKSMANGIILKSKTVTAIECLHYALNLPTSVVITGIDSMEILEQAFEAARTFHPMGEAQVQALLAKTAKRLRAASSSCSRPRRSSTAPHQPDVARRGARASPTGDAGVKWLAPIQGSRFKVHVNRTGCFRVWKKKRNRLLFH